MAIRPTCCRSRSRTCSNLILIPCMVFALCRPFIIELPLVLASALNGDAAATVLTLPRTSGPIERYFNAVPRTPAMNRRTLKMISAPSQPRLQEYTSSRYDIVAFVSLAVNENTELPSIVEFPVRRS
ncbi:hypothetical protein B0J14DRAFT_579293 [Halenospora varia]|nr:hypothetical protein B0J14DRAFT_579293 [Halenospora varia]